VLPTVIEPLRADWLMAQAAALVLAHEAAEMSGKPPMPNRKKRAPKSAPSPPALQHPRA